MRIPTIRASGNHFQVGFQIGVAARPSLLAMHAKTREQYAGRWDSLLLQSVPFLEATQRRLPNVLEELHGCAEGAGLPFEDLFLMSVEELLFEEVRGNTPQEQDELGKGCSDLAAAPPATADGKVWVAHNNDLSPGTEEYLYVTRFCADGEPEIIAVTVGGLFISVGLNRAGISLTGNEVHAMDSRPGVPRLLIVRDILAQTDFDAAVRSALLPERASSYNNLIASADGQIVNVEGSATDCELIWAERGGVYHANHYLSDKMKRYEPSGFYSPSSSARSSRARAYLEKYRGRIDREVCERFLRDHVFAPWSVCKHSGDSVTVFSVIVNPTERKMWLTRGNPCLSEYELFEFEAEHSPPLPA